MKNQYFGDINDYKKYGLLRALSGIGRVGTGVCWMLTPSDGRTDGRFLHYLDQPARWRRFDPDLFDHLHECVKVRRERDVRLIEDAQVLPNTSFYTGLLSDSIHVRRQYFTEMLERFRSTELVFFDPDNGFEVPSKLLGRKDSSKYLYWDELGRTYASGHSVLVYQHFTREKREQFVIRRADELGSRTEAPVIFSFRTPRVVFFLAAQVAHVAHLAHQAGQVESTWGDRIRVDQHL